MIRAFLEVRFFWLKGASKAVHSTWSIQEEKPLFCIGRIWVEFFSHRRSDKDFLYIILVGDHQP